MTESVTKTFESMHEKSNRMNPSNKVRFLAVDREQAIKLINTAGLNKKIGFLIFENQTRDSICGFWKLYFSSFCYCNILIMCVENSSIKTIHSKFSR